MPDNIDVQSGSYNGSLATDEISGVHHQRVKVGHGDDGVYNDVSRDNPLPVLDSSLHPDVQIERGEISGQSVERVEAINPALSTNLELIAPEPTADFPASAGKLQAVSTDAEDNPAGSGARLLRLYGLGPQHEEITEDLTLNGTSTVNTAKDFLRLNRVEVTETPGGAPAGTVTLSSGGTPVLTLEQGVQRSRSSQYTVPNGWTGYLRRLNVAAAAAPVEVRVERRDPAKPGLWLLVATVLTTATRQQDMPFIAVPGESDLRVQAKRLSGASDDPVAVDYELLLIADS